MQPTTAHTQARTLQERLGIQQKTVVFTSIDSVPADVNWCFFSAGIMHALPRSVGEVSYITPCRGGGSDTAAHTPLQVWHPTNCIVG